MSNGPPSLGVSPLATAGSVPNESGGLYQNGHPNNSHNHRHISNCPNNMQNYPQQQREQHPSPHAHHHRQQQSQQSQQQQQQQCAQSPTVIPQYHQHNHPPHQSSPAQASISSSSGYSHQLVTHHSNPTIHNHHQFSNNHSGSGTGANNSQSLANSIKAKYSNNSSGGNHHRSSNADSSGQVLFLPPGQTVSTISADSAFSAISPLSSVDTVSNNPCHNPNNNNPNNNNNPSPVPGPNLASTHSMGNTQLTAAQIQARLSLAPDHLLLKHDQLDQEQQEFQHLPMQQLSFSGSNYSQQHSRVDGDGGATGHHLSQSVQPLCPSTSSSLPPINNHLANHSISPESTLPTISTVPGPNLLKVRRYKLFPGRNRFFCKGRIVMAKQISVFYFTLTLLTCTCTLFFVFDCPFLATKVSPIIPAVAVALFFFVLFALLRTSFTDPGIIPRATAEEAADIERQIVPNLSNSPTYRPPPRTKEVIINDQPIKLKYCFTCKIFRPPRASHCSLCDNCVDRFDHHCPWVGNCVGKRNYRFFYMFIVSLAFLCIYIFSCIITHLILLSKNSTLFDAIKKSPVSVVEGAICFFSVWSILGLAGFHSYLIMSNMTTNEDIKGLFSSKRNDSITNPYSKGSPMKNCFSVLCDPWSPSLINARDEVYCDENTLAAIKSGSFGNASNSSKMMMPRPNLNAGGYPIQPHSFHTGGSYIAGSISATTPLPSYSHYGQQQYKMAYTDQSVGTGSSDLRHHHPLYYRPPPPPSQSQQSTSTDMNQFHNHHRGHQTEYNQYAVSGSGSCHRYHHQRQSSTPGSSKRLGSLTEPGSGSTGHNYSVTAATAAAAPSSNNQLSNNQFYGSLKKPLAHQSQQPNQGSIGSTGRSHNSKQQQQYSISLNEYQPQSQQVQQQYSLLHTTPGTSAGSSSASTSSAVASKSPLTVSGNLLAQTSQQPRSSFSSSSGSTSCPAAQHHNHQQESSPVPGVRQNHNQTQQQPPQSGQSRVHPDYHQSYYHHQGYN